MSNHLHLLGTKVIFSKLKYAATFNGHVSSAQTHQKGECLHQVGNSSTACQEDGSLFQNSKYGDTYIYIFIYTIHNIFLHTHTHTIIRGSEDGGSSFIQVFVHTCHNITHTYYHQVYQTYQPMLIITKNYHEFFHDLHRYKF